MKINTGLGIRNLPLFFFLCVGQLIKSGSSNCENTRYQLTVRNCVIENVLLFVGFKFSLAGYSNLKYPS